MSVARGPQPRAWGLKALFGTRAESASRLLFCRRRGCPRKARATQSGWLWGECFPGLPLATTSAARREHSGLVVQSSHPWSSRPLSKPFSMPCRCQVILPRAVLCDATAPGCWALLSSPVTETGKRSLLFSQMGVSSVPGRELAPGRTTSIFAQCLPNSSGPRKFFHLTEGISVFYELPQMPFFGTAVSDHHKGTPSSPEPLSTYCLYSSLVTRFCCS